MRDSPSAEKFVIDDLFFQKTRKPKKNRITNKLFVHFGIKLTNFLRITFKILIHILKHFDEVDNPTSRASSLNIY